jgi:hypothetical protein
MQSPESINNSPADEQAEARQPSLKWYPYFLVNGSLKEKVSKQPFEFSDCPTREDVETAIIESKFHPSGKYKIEKRKNGQPIEYFYCEKPDSSFFQQVNSKVVIETEPEFDDDEDSDTDAPGIDLNTLIEIRAESIFVERENGQLKRQLEEKGALEKTTSAQSLSAQNPFDQFFETLKRQTEMKELLFGEEIRELEELRRTANQPAAPTEPQSEKLAMLQYAEKMQNEKMQEKLLEYVFDEESGGGLLDTAKFVLANQDAVVSIGQKIIGALFGSTGGQTGAMQPSDLEAILKQKPPANGANGNADLPAPPRSNFQRRHKPATKAAPADKPTTAHTVPEATNGNQPGEPTNL